MDQTSKAKSPEEQLCQEGDAFRDISNNEEALKCYNHALGLNPDYIDAYLGKAWSLYLLERLDEALDCCNKIIELEPDNAKAYSRKGLIFDSLGRIDEGLECIEKAISIDPNLADAYINKSVLLQSQGKIEEVLECLEKAISADPKEHVAYYNKARSFLHNGKYQEALDCIKNACALSACCIYECLKGRCLQVLGRPEESRKAFVTARELIACGKPGKGLSGSNILFVENYLKNQETEGKQDNPENHNNVRDE